MIVFRCFHCIASGNDIMKNHVNCELNISSEENNNCGFEWAHSLIIRLAKF